MDKSASKNPEALALQGAVDILTGIEGVEFEVFSYVNHWLSIRGLNTPVPLDQLDLGFEEIGDRHQAIDQMMSDPANLAPCQFVFSSFFDLYDYVMPLKSSA